jgi:hypothetical protein
MANKTTNIDQISVSQAAKEVVANAFFDAASPASTFGRRASTCGGLTWGFYGGTIFHNGASSAVSNGTLALAASSTSYVFANPVTGAVQANNTGFDMGTIPLYQITTGADSVTDYTDKRTTIMPATTGYASKSISGAVDVQLTNAESLSKFIKLTGAITADIIVFCPDRPFEYVFENATTGAFEVEVSTLLGSSVKIPQGERCTVISDGSNFLLASTAGLVKRISKSVAGAVDVTLNANEYQAEILELTGAITANINVFVPLTSRQWTVFNNTTGAFTVTVIGATGTGIVVGQGMRAILYADGTNVVRATADV